MKISYLILGSLTLVGIYLLSSVPDHGNPNSQLKQIGYNLGHIPAYGLLTFFWIKGINPGIIKPFTRVFLYVLVALFLVTFSLFDEWHQSFVPGRFPSALDVGLDFFAILTVSAWMYLAENRKG